MASKPADKSTATKASDSSLALNTQLTQNAADQNAWYKQARTAQFGTPDASGKYTGGTLSKFLDPASMDVSAPTGAYATQYKNASDTISHEAQNARGSLARNLASRGFQAPTGFGADQERQSYLATAGERGNLFTDLAGKSYQDAVSNYWNANSMLQGGSAQALQSGLQADSTASSNYGNLYGSAIQPRPTMWGSLINAAGTVGAGAISKYCWIADALFGDHSPEANSVRLYLADEQPWWMWAYRALGKPTAWLVRHSDAIATAFRKPFEHLLREAQKGWA